MLATLFLFQAAASPDLQAPPLVQRCTSSNPDEIVVCGTRDDHRYRLAPLPDAKIGLGKAETSIAGAKLAIVAEQGEIGGIPTNRAMIRLKLKF